MKFNGKYIKITMCDDCDYTYRGSAFTLSVAGPFTQVYKNGILYQEFITRDISEITENYPC